MTTLVNIIRPNIFVNKGLDDCNRDHSVIFGWNRDHSVIFGFLWI